MRRFGVLLALAAGVVCVHVGLVASAGSGGGLLVLTHGANVGGTIQWSGPNTILFQADSDLDLATLPSGTITTLDGPGSSLWFDAVSPDGSTIAYTTYQPDVSVRTQPVAGGTPHEVASYPGGQAAPEQPIWRADGQRIAYTNDWNGGEIDTVPAAGGTPVVVLPGGGYLRRVIAYSAAGRLIVQQTDRAGNNGTLLTVTESGAATVLAADAYSAAASPDGARLAYFSKAGALYALPAAGGTPVPLGVSGYVFPDRLAFSPDGTLVGAAGYDSKFKPLGHVAHADGSGAVRLPYRVGSLGWAPDGRRLVLAGADSKGTQGVAIVNPDGTNLRVLVEATCPRPTFSPDGSRIACVAYVTDPDTGSPSNELGLVSLETVLTMGPQAMEGSLRVSPGATLRAGYDFSVPGTHPTATVSFSEGRVTFQATCVSQAGGGSITVPIADNAYVDPANSPAWYPSGDRTSESVYQGSIVVPDLCSGGQISLSKGGTFTTAIASTDDVHPVSVRWHYSANGSDGKWSATSKVVPLSG